MRAALLSVLALASVSYSAAAPLRLSGSTTLKGVLEPHLPALQAAAEQSIQLNGTGSMTGLASLAIGSSDVAMLSCRWPTRWTP